MTKLREWSGNKPLFIKIKIKPINLNGKCGGIISYLSFRDKKHSENLNVRKFWGIGWREAYLVKKIYMAVNLTLSDWVAYKDKSPVQKQSNTSSPTIK